MLARTSAIPDNIHFSAKIDGWGFEEVDGKQTVIYSITVVSSNGCSWCVRRRYSEFRDNFLTIGFQFPKSKAARFQFPRKTVFSSINNSDERKELLQKYLNCLLQISPTPVEVQYFLRITRISLGLDEKSKVLVRNTSESEVSTPTTPINNIPPDLNPHRDEHNEDCQDDELFFIGDAGKTPDNINTGSENNSDRESVSDNESNTKQSNNRARFPRARLKRQSVHSQAALRPFSLEHHLILLDDDLDHDIMDFDPSKALKPRTMVILIVFGSFLCVLRIICKLIHYKIKYGYALYPYDLLTHIKDMIVSYWTSDQSTVKWMVKTSFFWFLIAQTFHRLVGFLLTEYLQMLLSTPKGAFKMSFKSIVLRLGFIYNDCNEIVVNEYVWHNPPRFRETPYFGRVKQLRIRFCLLSLWRAITRREHIEILDLELEGLTVYMEKGKRVKDGLNLWACLGAENAEESQNLRQGIATKLASIVHEVGGGIMHVGETVGGVAKGIVGGVGAVGKGIVGKAQDIGNKLKLKSTKAAKKAPSEDGSYIPSPSEKAQHNAVAHEVADIAAKLNSRHHDHLNFTHKEIHDDIVEAEEWPELEFHWGVPYKILCRHFIARDLTFYVKDFLAAKHTEHKPIVINTLSMYYDDLTGRPDTGSKERKPLWMDDMLWRVINKLITELLKTNTIGLLATVGASGFNQAADTALNAAKSGSRQAVQSVYNYNPKEMANATVRGLHYLRYIGAPKFARSPSIQDLKVDTLRVYLLAIRGLKHASGQAEDIMSIIHRRRNRSIHEQHGPRFHVDRRTGLTTRVEEEVHDEFVDSRKDVTCVCSVKMELKNQPGKASEDQLKMFQYKSNAVVPNAEDDEFDRRVYEFGERFDIENLITLNAELYIRVFESSLIKDTTLGEITLPLKDDISTLLDEAAGRDMSKTASPRVKDDHGNWIDSNQESHVKYLCGIREEKVGWYLLYAKGSNEIVGEIQLAMMLC